MSGSLVWIWAAFLQTALHENIPFSGNRFPGFSAVVMPYPMNSPFPMNNLFAFILFMRYPVTDQIQHIHGKMVVKDG